MTMTTKRASILMFTLLILPCLFATVAQAADDKKAEEQQEVRKMAQGTLQRLYKAEPSTQAAIRAAAGYAVFSNTGLKIFMLGSGKGEGIAVNNKTNADARSRGCSADTCSPRESLSCSDRLAVRAA